MITLMFAKRYFTQEQGKGLERLLTLKIEAIEKLIFQQIKADQIATVEARRLMERTMEGFPAEYAKKLEMEATASLVNDLKEKDLKILSDRINETLPRKEYTVQHIALANEIKILQDQTAKSVTRTELLATVVGAAAIVFGIIEFFKG